ncbi:MAG: hypothetical protein B6D61_06980 [Bacteroidetes bacterium 4484_249]|nr:MAG: hypothetical protein B6D61_06980 [Bacteroidetes bacterium 4484_249]
MKKKDVPQDDEGLLEGKFRELCYAIDEDGNYVTVQSTGWEPKNAALQQAWVDINDKIDKIKNKVYAGKLSPLAYYMEKNILDIKLLSQYTGMPKRKIRRHIKPVYFNKLDSATLKKYADVLNITIEELKTINFAEEKK